MAISRRGRRRPARTHRLFRLVPGVSLPSLHASGSEAEGALCNQRRSPSMSALAWILYGCCALAAGSVHASPVPSMTERFRIKGRASRRDACSTARRPSCRRLAANRIVARKTKNELLPQEAAHWPWRQGNYHCAADVAKLNKRTTDVAANEGTLPC